VYISYTGHTQKNGVVSIGITIETAPFFCVYPVYTLYMQIAGFNNKTLSESRLQATAVCSRNMWW
jgi:hypothetical protein